MAHSQGLLAVAATEGRHAPGTGHVFARRETGGRWPSEPRHRYSRPHGPGPAIGPLLIEVSRPATSRGPPATCGSSSYTALRNRRLPAYQPCAPDPAITFLLSGRPSLKR